MITWKQLNQSVLSSIPGHLYTAPVLTATAIHQVSAWNPTTQAVTLKVFILPPIGTAVDATTVWSMSISANTAAQITQMIGHKLQSGQQLYASGAGITLTISGAESV